LWIAPVCLACNIDFIRWGGGGLETPLYVLCITASFAWIWYRHPAVCSAAGIAAAGAALTRPEGIIAGPLMAGAVWWVFRRNSAPKTTRTATATLCAQRIFDWWLLIVIPYHLWRITYFGEILPNTFYCKVSCIRTSWAHGIMYVADFFRSNGHLVLLTGAATGCISRWQRLWPQTVLGLILTGMVVLEGGDWMPYHRFMLPILPILLLLFAAGCETCRNRFTASPGVATVTLLIAVAFLLCQPLIPHSNAITAGFTATRHILMGNSPSKGLIQEPVSRITSNDETWLLGQRAAGEWLGANARPGASLALGAAGVIPYYSGLRTVDFFGLVTPSVARGRKRSGWSMAGHQKYDREIILDVEPDYIVFSGTADPSREPRWWLKKFKLLDCPEFRDNYVYRMVDIGTCRFGYYERIAPATAQNDP
ncbi:MAG TPA: hypothetical protein PLV45_15560, partial [bacterium]|nr:hypothetical protein [bacterium]